MLTATKRVAAVAGAAVLIVTGLTTAPTTPTSARSLTKRPSSRTSGVRLLSTLSPTTQSATSTTTGYRWSSKRGTATSQSTATNGPDRRCWTGRPGMFEPAKIPSPAPTASSKTRPVSAARDGTHQHERTP